AARIREHLPRTVFREPEYEACRAGVTRKDPLKLVLYDAGGARDGFQLRDELVAHGCVPEMADAKYVVLALGTGTAGQDADRLIETLIALSADRKLGETALPDEQIHTA